MFWPCGTIGRLNQWRLRAFHVTGGSVSPAMAKPFRSSALEHSDCLTVREYAPSKYLSDRLDAIKKLADDARNVASGRHRKSTPALGKPDRRPVGRTPAKSGFSGQWLPAIAGRTGVECGGRGVAGLPFRLGRKISLVLDPDLAGFVSLVAAGPSHALHPGHD